MPKHPVPKRRASHARSSRRHSTFLKLTLKKLNDLAAIVPCPKCKSPRLSHTACPTCGEYRGRLVVQQKKTPAKVTKVSA